MIDVELPQIRASVPVTPEPLSWVHLYPTGKKDYVNSFMDGPDLSINDIASSTEATFSEYKNGNWSSSNSSSSTSAVLAAFVAGLVVALLVMQFVVHRRPRRQTGYTAVPDHVEEIAM